MISGAAKAVCLTLMFFSQFAGAVQCWLNGALNMNFGVAGNETPSSTWNSMGGACYGPWTEDSVTWHVRFCHFVNPAPDTGSISPRYMTLWDGSRMQYDLYSDPAMTLILGGVGNTYPLSSWIQDVANNTTAAFSMMIYGKVPARQPGLSSGVYQSSFSGGVLRWRWSSGNRPAPSAAECLAGSGGEGGGEVSYFLNVSATAQDTCLIRSVTDLDFGVHSHQISSPLDSRAELKLSCPKGTSWQLALDNGLSSQGNIRYMINDKGDKVEYQLFRDVAGTQMWGHIAGSDTLTGTGNGAASPVSVSIYGKVPIQTAISPGYYRDTVIVTLSY